MNLCSHCRNGQGRRGIGAHEHFSRFLEVAVKGWLVCNLTWTSKGLCVTMCSNPLFNIIYIMRILDKIGEGGYYAYRGLRGVNSDSAALSAPLDWTLSVLAN